jgi:hypothetical protein
VAWLLWRCRHLLFSFASGANFSRRLIPHPLHHLSLSAADTTSKPSSMTCFCFLILHSQRVMRLKNEDRVQPPTFSPFYNWRVTSRVQSVTFSPSFVSVSHLSDCQNLLPDGFALQPCQHVLYLNTLSLILPVLSFMWYCDYMPFLVLISYLILSPRVYLSPSRSPQ